MKAIPQIQKFMTTTPYSISSESTVQEALDVMNDKDIRHLPVMKAGAPYGLISDRDLKSVMAFAGSNPKAIKIGEICNDLPYVTKPQAALNEVAVEMAERKIGSALVVDNNKLVGIFTATDACKALAEIVETRFHS